MACAFLSLALLSFDVFPWFRDPVLPHRPTYPLGIAGMALFILSGQWRGRMKEHLLLLGGISGLAVLAALATAWGLQSVPGDVAPDVWTGFLLWTLIPLAFWLWWAVMFSCLPCETNRYFMHLLYQTPFANTSRPVVILCISIRTNATKMRHGSLRNRGKRGCYPIYRQNFTQPAQKCNRHPV